jgi:hypothetical protein
MTNRIGLSLLALLAGGTGVPAACWAGGVLGAGAGVCAAAGKVTMTAAKRLGPKRRFIDGEPALREAAS